MRLRHFLPGDLAAVEARADFRADFIAAGAVLPEGPTWTLQDADGGVLGVAGFKPLGRDGHKLLGAWAYLSDMRPRDWLRAARKARETCAYAIALGYAGIYATPADTDAARRLLAFIGFRPSPDDAGVWKFQPPETL